MFEKYNIPPEKICFEITETWVVSDLVIAKSNKNRIKSLGCCIAIDDYWVWNSSLEKLNDETYDRVKLDWSLITGLIIDWKVDEVKLAIIEKTCDVAKLLWIKVIAEFVNWKDVKKILKEVWVQYFQGYESSWEPFLLNDILIRNEYR
jgi:EAL domain-containing protein (putative c-di-GMP-specific phosphodiesterase class I)